jgi:hypothetical protein
MVASKSGRPLETGSGAGGQLGAWLWVTAEEAQAAADVPLPHDLPAASASE